MTRRAHAMPFGAQIEGDGVRFAIWAPDAGDVVLALDGVDHAMETREDGWRQIAVAGAKAGARYGYRIDGGEPIPDPASRFQPDDAMRLSAVIDPCNYDWKDETWRGRPWEEAVIYELHVGAATARGDFAGLMEKLDELRDLGVTAIELMPVADFVGSRNWGYDGVLPYSPDSAYGAPDDLKRLVDAAHARGLMIFLDVVYNHFGPSGNFLNAYAKRFFTKRHPTPWGAGFNFDGDSATVREFFVHNALYWLEEYHVDGLRLDAVHAIHDDSDEHVLEEIARRARAAFPDRHIHLILENDDNEACLLSRQDDGQPRLYTAQWNDDLHHCWHALLTGEKGGYYADYADAPAARLGRCLSEGFAYQGEPSSHRKGQVRGETSVGLPPSAFISFLQNHDQIGNRALGERLSALAAPERLDLAMALLLLSPQIPMLFMGEEWRASSPFLYFVDFAHDDALSKAVREGRRREFAGFEGFADKSARVPDPTAVATFHRSVLSGDERNSKQYREALDMTGALLKMRRDKIAPLTKSAFHEATRRGSSPDVIDVSWRYAAGTLRMIANLGAESFGADMGGGAIVWRSPRIVETSHRLSFPQWTGAVLARRE